MPSTDELILAEVNAAILAIVQGRTSSYSINGRPVTRLDLGTLEEMKTRYEQRISRACKGLFSVSQFRDPE